MQPLFVSPRTNTNMLSQYIVRDQGLRSIISNKLKTNQLLVPSGLPGRTINLLAICPSVRPSVCLSVCPSVRHTSVFRTFLCCLLRYRLAIWYMNVSWHNIDRVWVSSRLTDCYRSYCPLLKFSFLDFSLQSFETLTWNLVYEFVVT